jgi:hypothetical protein
MSMHAPDTAEQPSPESDVGPDHDAAVVDTRCGTAVKRIRDPSRRNAGAFRPLYSEADAENEVEVELLREVSAEKSKTGERYVLIDRPDWTEPKRAQPDEIRVITEDAFQ